MEVIRYNYNCCIKETVEIDIEALKAKYNSLEEACNNLDAEIDALASESTNQIIEFGDQSEICEDTYYELERLWQTHP